MGAPTETYIDPAEGASNGNDHGGNGFVDGSWANATLTLTKAGAFTAATCQAGDKIYLDDNGSGEVTPGLYTISARVDDNNVTLTADIRSGAPDPTDVRCDQHTGAVALPWATVQHALDFTTRDAANGDRFNVKAGTDDVLAAALDFTTYGNPTAVGPWILQGYTTSAGDGGIGGIDCDASFSVFASTALDYITIQDMHLHNAGAQDIINLDNYIHMINVEVDDTSATGIQIDSTGKIKYCYVHNVGTYGIRADDNNTIEYCTLENGTNDFDVAIITTGANTSIRNNVISVDSSSDGIQNTAVTPGALICIEGNSIYSSGGTGQGIIIAGKGTILLNNIVEGFSGVGGIGYDVNEDLTLYGHNSAYNNATNFDLAGGTAQYRNLGNNTVLGSSPFSNPGAGNFEVDTSVQAGGWPTAFKGIATDTFIDEGAAQREETGAAVGWW